jgi:Skp family chaperone for outer membrane proteins
VNSSTEAGVSGPYDSLFDKLNLKLLTNKEKHQEEKDMKKIEKIEREADDKKKEKEEELKKQQQQRPPRQYRPF